MAGGGPPPPPAAPPTSSPSPARARLRSPPLLEAGAGGAVPFGVVAPAAAAAARDRTADRLSIFLSFFAGKGKQKEGRGVTSAAALSVVRARVMRRDEARTCGPLFSRSSQDPADARRPNQPLKPLPRQSQAWLQWGEWDGGCEACGASRKEKKDGGLPPPPAAQKGGGVGGVRSRLRTGVGHALASYTIPGTQISMAMPSGGMARGGGAVEARWSVAQERESRSGSETCRPSFLSAAPKRKRNALHLLSRGRAALATTHDGQ